jgi:hypothetical protein
MERLKKNMKSLNRRKRGRFAKVPKSKSSKVGESKGSSLAKAWEFENYVRERLRALGIIQ